MATTIKTVTSNPDPHSQQVTRLHIIKDDVGTMTMSVKLRRPNEQPMEILNANIDDLFAIRFIKHDLVGNQTYPNWAHWGYVEYKPSAGQLPVLPEFEDIVLNGVPGVALKYKLVEYKVDTSARPADLLPHVRNLSESVNEQTLGPIDVTVNIGPAVLPFNHGWINFHIDHSYPSKFPNAGTPEALNEGWEERIIFPSFKFTSLNIDSFKHLLSPLLGYGALYKVKPNFRNQAEGVAIHVEDGRGHYRESHYDESIKQLSFHLLNPVHLKDAPLGKKAYVKPPSYVMTGGDNYGFGGNNMAYRLRAFEILSVRPQVPIDRRDVLDIYRRWVKGRQPLFYRKYRPRRTDGPLDSMALHTVITNFSLDGPVDVNRDAKLAQWLEQHPAKHGEPNVPNNPNESFLSLLSRLRSRFNVWSGWEDLGGGLKAGPAVSSWGANRLDCFAWGTDDQLHHRAFDGVWRAWQPLGGVLTSPPGAVSWGVNRIDVFVRGTDNALYHKFYDGAWRNWASLGGGLNGGPAATSWGPNRLDVFVCGTDNALHHKTFDGVWRNWVNLGGALTSGPAAVSWGVNRIDVFAPWADGAIYQNTFNGSSWGGWKSLGQPSSTVQVGSKPAVSSWRPNRLDLFVRGTDNALWRRIFDGAWGSWERIGGNFQNAPAAVSMRPQRIDCFVSSVPNSTMSHVWSDLTMPADSLGPARPVLLEAQLWNCEMAGLYRFYGGFPPMADVLSNSARFKRGMDELAANGILPYFTTDPLNCILNRKRFRGHLLSDGAGGWRQAIRHPFPDAVKNRACAATDVDITVGGVTHRDIDRVWYVHKEPPEITINPEPRAVPSCSELATALGSMTVDAFGRTGLHAPPAMGNGFYRSMGTRMCPTAAVERIYLDSWLQNGLFAQGARLVEFMKHSFYGSGFCYNKNHQHIVSPDPNDLPDPSDPADPPSLPYTTVIGRGFWHIRRCRSILRGVQRRGLATYASFALAIEFSQPESMLPYVDEHYASGGVDPDTQFVYSNMLTAKIGGFTDFALPPGYKESRRNTLLLRVPPVDMLSPARDDDPQPTTEAALDTSFKNWLGMCTAYFNRNFVISEPGLSPQNYETYTPDPARFPPTYSFCRGIQDTFNLRARIFAIGPAAIKGYRITVPAVYMEEPHDYNEEVVNFASRAAQLLFRHRDFFRAGFIVGETPFTISRANNQTFNTPTVWAWGSYNITSRPFHDVQKLVDDITREDPYLGKDYQRLIQAGSNGKTFRLHDFIAQPVDRRIYYFKGPGGNLLELYRNNIRVYPRVSHLIWQIGDTNASKVLYLFVNVTNTPTQVEFHYDRGLATPAGINWSKTISWISGDGNSQIKGTVRFDDVERQTIPPRSFMSIELER